MATSAANRPDHDALIIGAGFSGLYQLHCLRDRLGLDAKVLEQADGVGGTWYWNRYPGARCDSESHSYSYYFSKQLLDGWEWSERYPGHAEIRRYLAWCADQLALWPDIRLNTRVTGARYDEGANLWRVSLEGGEELSATYLITAVGCLSSTNVPDIPGLSDFKGQWYHTGQWPHEGVDFTGKRVGQIGTGSTGIQAAPVIAAEADHLTVFQRTANFSVPAHNHPLSPERKAEIRARQDEFREIMHSTPNGHPFRIADRCAVETGDAARRDIYEAAWERGGLRFRGCFQDLLVDRDANDTAAEFIKSKIRDIVKDPETAMKLTSIDHPYAAKRPPIDTGYFQTFNRDNVSLVDIRKNPIRRITETGIETADGHHDVEVIVFATGFDAMSGTLLKLNLTGRDGRTLKDAWAEGPKTYLGLQMAGFPNLFTVTGPGSPSVLCNMPVAIEQHVEWITDCIADMRARGVARIEPLPGAVEAWVAHTNEAAHATLLVEAGHSWYFGANIPGKPQVFMPYAGGMKRYRDICDQVRAAGYSGFALDGSEVVPADVPPPGTLTPVVQTATPGV